LLADDERIYLIVNHSDSDMHTFGESLTSIRVNGAIYAWDRLDHRFLWRQSVKNQNLVIDRFAKSPVLLFISRSWPQRRRIDTSIGRLSIAAIHKQSGRILIDTKFPSAYNAFHAVDIDPVDRTIELKSYNVRLRLVSMDDGSVPATETKDPNATNQSGSIP
jgi:hypothetical protein